MDSAFQTFGQALQEYREAGAPYEEEARALYKEVIRGYTEQLGAQHTATLTAKNNLATLLKARRERDKARALYDEVISLFLYLAVVGIASWWALHSS